MQWPILWGSVFQRETLRDPPLVRKRKHLWVKGSWFGSTVRQPSNGTVRRSLLVVGLGNGT